MSTTTDAPAVANPDGMTATIAAIESALAEPPPPPTRGLFVSAGEGSDGAVHNLDGDRCLCDHRYAGEPIVGENDAVLAGAQPCARTVSAWMRPGGARADDSAIVKIATIASQAMVKQTNAREPIPFRPKNTSEMFRYAQMLAASDLVPRALARKPNDILVVLLKGEDLGLSPQQAIAGINVIDGKAEVGALTMVSMVRRSGLCEEWRLVSSDKTQATYYTKRRGASEGVTFSYTLDEAREAGLLDKGRDAAAKARSPWNTQRRTMLRRRAQSFLAREEYSDICAGLYDHEELSEMRELEKETIRIGHAAQRAGFAVVQDLPDPGPEPQWMAAGERPAGAEVLPAATPAPAPTGPRDPMKERLRQRSEQAKQATPPDEVICTVCKDPMEPPPAGMAAICDACSRQ